MSEGPTQRQDPPATEPTEAMVEAAAWAMCAEEGDWDELDDDGRAAWRHLARAALIAGIAAALDEANRERARQAQRTAAP